MKENRISWSNWSIVLLTLVYVLSFIYFVGKPFAEDKMEVKCAKELYISHYWGNIHYSQYFHIKNSGKVQGTITKFEGFIIGKDNTTFRKKMNAQSLDQEMGNPILEISLNSNEIINDYVNFYKINTKSARDSIAYFENSIYEDLEQKMNYTDPEKIIELFMVGQKISDWKYQKIYNFIKNNGINELEEGEYQYLVQLWKNDEKKPFYRKCFSFVIYEFNLRVLRYSINEYEKGGPNLYFNRPRPKMNFKVNITEIPETDKEFNRIMDLYNKE